MNTFHISACLCAKVVIVTKVVDLFNAVKYILRPIYIKNHPFCALCLLHDPLCDVSQPICDWSFCCGFFLTSFRKATDISDHHS